MKAWALLLLMISLFSQSLMAEDLSIRFEDLHNLIKTHHKGVKLGEEQSKAAEQRVHSIDQSFLPKATLDLGTAHKKEANGMGETAAFWRMDIETNLYRGGRDEVAKAISENQVEIKKMDAQAFLRTQTYRARSAYLKLFFLQKQLSLLMTSRSDYEALQKSIQIKINSGLLTQSILQIMNIEQDEIVRQHLAIRSELKSQEEELCLLLGLDHNSAIKLISNFEIQKNQEQTNQAPISISEDLPEIQKINILNKRYSLEKSIKNESWRPDVSVFASYGSFAIKDRFEPGPLPDREMSFGLRLSMDLEGKETLNRERFAKESETRALLYQKELLRDEMQHKSEEFLRDMNTRLRLIMTYEESLKKSEKLQKRFLNEFDRGLVNSNDVFGNIRSIQSLKHERIEEELKYFLARNAYDSMTEEGIN